MRAHRRRTILGVCCVALASAALIGLEAALAPALLDSPHLAGWTLLVVLGLLLLLTLRKKIFAPPLLGVGAWTQAHIYLGLFAFVPFAVHLDYGLPNGIFESVLAALFLAVSLSGLGGLIITRSFPRRLTARGDEVIYETVARVRATVRHEAEDLALHAVAETGSSTLSDFYTDHLKSFFDGPRNFWRHLFESRRPAEAIVRELEEIERYLDDEEMVFAGRMADLIRRKDRLDYQLALQSVLKGWLFVHVPLTYSLLMFVLVHVLLVLEFGGGA